MVQLYLRRRVRLYVGNKKDDGIGGACLEWENKGVIWARMLPHKAPIQRCFSDIDKLSKVFKLTVRASEKTRDLPTITKVMDQSRTYYGVSAPQLSPCLQWVEWHVGLA